MISTATCEKCGTEFSNMDGIGTMATLVKACNASLDQLVFQVTCPHCGEFTKIVYKY